VYLLLGGTAGLLSGWLAGALGGALLSLLLWATGQGAPAALAAPLLCGALCGGLRDLTCQNQQLRRGWTRLQLQSQVAELSAHQPLELWSDRVLELFLQCGFRSGALLWSRESAAGSAEPDLAQLLVDAEVDPELPLPPRAELAGLAGPSTWPSGARRGQHLILPIRDGTRLLGWLVLVCPNRPPRTPVTGSWRELKILCDSLERNLVQLLRNKRAEVLLAAVEVLPDQLQILGPQQRLLYRNCAARGQPGLALSTDCSRVQAPDPSGHLHHFQKLEAEFALPGGTGRLELQRDVSGEVQLAEQVQRQARLDLLTGLHNRNGLIAELERRLDLGDTLTVLLVDVIDFKWINLSHGLAAGDTVLCELARRLSQLSELVSRIGGDEFVVVLSNPTEAAELQRLVGALSAPVELGEQPVWFQLRGGYAQSQPGTTPDALLQQAETARLRARQFGQVIADAGPQAAAPVPAGDVFRLEGALWEALRRGRLQVHFQPIRAASGGTWGVEALARWCDPALGDIPPGVFVPLAERRGLILELDRLVLSLALEAAQTLRERGLRLAVNLSPASFHDPGIQDRLRAALDQHGFPGDQLIVEITERTLLNPELARPVLEGIHAMGIRLAADDFGVGYSSLAYLQDYPLDLIKIDGHFVEQLLRNHPGGGRLLKTMVDMAHALDMLALAERVETGSQQASLIEMGCDLLQGFHLGRPLSLSELLSDLTREK
jgi:diguanylate cyclase (GGDEF)-like protein